MGPNISGRCRGRRAGRPGAAVDAAPDGLRDRGREAGRPGTSRWRPARSAWPRSGRRTRAWWWPAGTLVYAVLNLYPYNPGHLMVCPYRHVADYTDLDEAETVELGRFTQTAMRVIRRVSGPHGFNLGMNQGHVAGAGIAAHLHQHVVPRWGGDTNFMPVIGADQGAAPTAGRHPAAAGQGVGGGGPDAGFGRPPHPPAARQAGQGRLRAEGRLQPRPLQPRPPPARPRPSGRPAHRPSSERGATRT